MGSKSLTSFPKEALKHSFELRKIQNRAALVGKGGYACFGISIQISAISLSQVVGRCIICAIDNSRKDPAVPMELSHYSAGK